MTRVDKVCVYCASSRMIHDEFLSAAEQLGRLLARNGTTIIFGGGAVGAMGRLAEGALAEGGKIIGIIYSL